MEMKELDNLQYSVQILNGIRDTMMLMESSTIREVPISVCIVSEIAVEKAISLLGRVEEAVGKEIKLRKTGLGGSDAGAVCGLNPYSSPVKVYHDKTTDVMEESDSEAVRIGHDLEDYVAKRFMEATGLKVRRSNYMYRSKEHPFMIADDDRLVIGEDAGLECKTVSAYNADKWKNGNIPLHYIMQCVLPLYVSSRNTYMVYCCGYSGTGIYMEKADMG